MRKIKVVFLISILCLCLSGCATVEYFHSDNYDYSVAQGYKVYLEEDYLKAKGYELKDMKEFLFKFFALYAGEVLDQDDIEDDLVKRSFSELDMSWELSFKKENNKAVVCFSQIFTDQTAYNNYFGNDGKSDGESSRVVEKGFFYYRIIDTIQSPFLIVKQSWNDLYDEEFYTVKKDNQTYIDFARVFVLGIKNSAGEVVFKGFREEFPNIPQDDIKELLYRFVLSYGRGRMEDTADRVEHGVLLTSLIWERNDETIGNEIKLVTLKPNSVGWNILALVLTALFAGILVLVAFFVKKNRPKITPVQPVPPKVPPSVFGDEYR
ncbi:MAG TPA: hypothetical protein VIL26_06750 [Clostridia bacterium]